MSALNYSFKDEISSNICKNISWLGMNISKGFTFLGTTLSSLMLITGVIEQDKNCAISSFVIGALTAFNYYFLSALPKACYRTSKTLAEFNHLLQFRDSYLFIDAKETIRFSKIFNKKFEAKNIKEDAKITEYTGIALMISPIVVSILSSIFRGTDIKHYFFSIVGISGGATGGYMLMNNANSLFKHRKFFEIKELLPHQRKNKYKNTIKL